MLNSVKTVFIYMYKLKEYLSDLGDPLLCHLLFVSFVDIVSFTRKPPWGVFNKMYCVVLRCAVLCCIVLCCCVVLCCTVLSRAVLYCSPLNFLRFLLV